MTLEEKLFRAKLYADKLASCVDPISNKSVPEDSILSQPRLLRYFAFISEILNERISLNMLNDDVSNKVQAENRDETNLDNSNISMYSGESFFQIKRYALNSIMLSDEPIPISYLAKRIQAKAVYGSNRFSHRWVTNWLLDEGYLYKHNNSNSRIPTTAGTKLGIFQELRPCRNDELLITLYRKDAQKFVLDHIADILEFNGYHEKFYCY